MWILFFRNKIVDQANDKNSEKEETYIHPDSLDRSVSLGQGGGPFLKNFNKRYVEHNACGKTGGYGEKAMVGLFGQEGNCTTNSGGHTCKES